MNNIKYFLFSCLFYCLPIIMFADGICDDALSEGKQYYNSGNYHKAKDFFEFVKNECGSYYGDVNNWINKCETALSPTLSVSKSQISCSASGTTQYITVTSNTTWELQYSSGNMYSVVRNGNSLTVTIYSTTSTESRTDFFNVKTTDGKIVKKITLSQTGKSVSNSLGVSKTLISCSASATTEYITVTSNTSWQIEHPTGTMYSVTRNGNTLTVRINANTSTNAREDYFNVKTTDGRIVKKITLKQSGKVSYSSNSYAVIDNAWIDHNVYENGVKGMRIHVNVAVHYALNHKVGVAIYISYKNGNKLKDYNGSYKIFSDGNVGIYDTDIATYESTRWKDWTIFFPYSELHMESGCKDLSLQVNIGIYDSTDDKWLTSSDQKIVGFTFSN